MQEIITATFIDGAFVPEQAITVPSGTRVKLTVESVDPTPAEIAFANHPQPTGEQIAKFNELCDRIGSKVKGFKKLTRDQLHERR